MPDSLAASAIIRRLSLILGVVPVLSCGDAPTAPVGIGSASISIQTASGTRVVTGEAAYYIDHADLTGTKRYLYLVVGTKDHQPGARWVSLQGWLPDNQDYPPSGAFAVVNTGVGEQITGDVHAWIDTTMVRLPPTTGTDSLRLQYLGMDQLNGQFHIFIPRASSASPTPAMTIHGTFLARGVANFQDLFVQPW